VRRVDGHLLAVDPELSVKVVPAVRAFRYGHRTQLLALKYRNIHNNIIIIIIIIVVVVIVVVVVVVVVIVIVVIIIIIIIAVVVDIVRRRLSTNLNVDKRCRRSSMSLSSSYTDQK